MRIVLSQTLKRSEGDRIFLDCPECNKETYQDVVHILRRRNGVLDAHVDFGEENTTYDFYNFIQCRGCNSASILHRFGLENDTFWSVQYPSPVSRREPPWLSQLGKEEISGKQGSHYVELLREIYGSVAGRHLRVACMGLRALLEQVMVQTVADQGSFSKNLDKFYVSGHVSLKQRDALSNILEAGHAVTHRFYKPSEDDMSTLLDVTESILASVFIHPQTSALVADRVPRRTEFPREKK